MYFREYFCSFSSKSYYFYILGVSHLNMVLICKSTKDEDRSASKAAMQIF